MGSAIAVDYLANFENSYKGVFLSAPMFDIFTPTHSLHGSCP